MQWMEVGHEFDESYAHIEKLKGIYLWGVGHDGNMVYEIITKRYSEINIVNFIDNDPKKIGKKFKDRDVIAIEDIKRTDDIGIVVSFASEFTRDIDNQLEKAGYCRGVSFWHYEEFLSIYAAYAQREVFFSSICILPTTACNLRCKSCLNFTKYISKFECTPIDRMKIEIDLYFKVVNYTGLFFISGGEPLLYPDIVELIKYITKNYSDRYYELGIVTNGTIKPQEELLTLINRGEIRITVDDYRDQLQDRVTDIENNIGLFLGVEKNSNVIVRKYDEWISLYPHGINELSEDVLRKKYAMCHCPWQEYREGMLFSCNYASFACKAELAELNPSNDVYKLSEYKDADMKKLIEFRLGYTVNGYVDFCKRCAGYMDINPYRVAAAEQE